MPSPVSFLPYLSGERTPHDDPDVRGMLDGLGHGTDRDTVVQAVLEGVAFALADCRDVLSDSGIAISGKWMRSAAARVRGSGFRCWPMSSTSRSIGFADGETGAAFGAARRGRLAVSGEPVEAVCTAPQRDRDVRARPRACAQPMPSGCRNGAACTVARGADQSQRVLEIHRLEVMPEQVPR